jgi:hypothetical protein
MGPTEALGFMNVVVLHGNHRNSLAILVTIFRAMKKIVKICIRILVFITLKMPT